VTNVKYDSGTYSGASIQTVREIFTVKQTHKEQGREDGVLT